MPTPTARPDLGQPSSCDIHHIRTQDPIACAESTVDWCDSVVDTATCPYGCVAGGHQCACQVGMCLADRNIGKRSGCVMNHRPGVSIPTGRNHEPDNPTDLPWVRSDWSRPQLPGSRVRQVAANCTPTRGGAHQNTRPLGPLRELLRLEPPVENGSRPTYCGRPASRFSQPEIWGRTFTLLNRSTDWDRTPSCRD